MNKAIICGNLGKDCEIVISTKGTRIGKFSVATTHSYKLPSGEYANDTTWHNIVSFGISDKLSDILKKGTKVLIEGRIENKIVETNGQKNNYSSIIMEKVEVLSNPLSQKPSRDKGWDGASEDSTTSYGDGTGDGELPF